MKYGLKEVVKLKSIIRKGSDNQLREFLQNIYNEGFKDGSGFDSDLEPNYICSICGNSLDDSLNARYCKWCGTELDFSNLERKEDE